MKNSGVEWIGEIPEDWEVKPLTSLFSFGKGLPITKEDLKEVMSMCRPAQLPSMGFPADWKNQALFMESTE